jgi:voltage-gated potassium channel
MQRHRFDMLLCALILLLLSAPVVRIFLPTLHPLFASITVTACFVLMLLSAVIAISQSRRTAIVALSLSVPVVLLSGLNLSLERQGTAIAYHVLGVSFLGYTVVMILAFLFREQRVTFNLICASLCVYLLLGVLWAIVYSLLDVLEPESFRLAFAQGQDGQQMRFGAEQSIFPLYYSLVTMTTLGYGDIVPMSPSARMFAAVEALMGQLYLAVLVARLVGLHISQSTRGKFPGEGGRPLPPGP